MSTSFFSEDKNWPAEEVNETSEAILDEDHTVVADLWDEGSWIISPHINFSSSVIFCKSIDTIPFSGFDESYELFNVIFDGGYEFVLEFWGSLVSFQE